MKVALIEIELTRELEEKNRNLIKIIEVDDEEYIRPIAELIYKRMKQAGVLDKLKNCNQK